MKNQICVSSYSVRQLLGPITITVRGPDGKKVARTWGPPATQPMTLLGFPAQAREQLELDAVEICQFHLPEKTPSYVGKLKRALADAGVTLVDMPIDVGNISDPNAAYREEDLADIEDWMRIAADLGSAMVRVNASNPMAKETAPLDVTVESYRRLAKTAESLGLQLLVENHGGITADPETIVKLVEGVGDGKLKTLVDVGNFEPLMSARMAAWRGEKAQSVDPSPVYASVARIAPYAGLVHAKTHEFDERGRPTDFDVVRALRVVRDTGYDGPISLEYEGNVGDPWEQTKRTKALVEEAFD